MSTLSVLFLALVCSMFPASIPADHGQMLIADQIYEDTADRMPRTNYHKLVYNENTKEVTSLVNRTISINNGNSMRQYTENVRRKRETDACEFFSYNAMKKIIEHPRKDGETTYSRNTTCITLIEAGDGEVIQLTFIDVFHIEEHPNCDYDYIEIRDGQYGFAKSYGRLCGRSFPQRITSSGPYLWLKFKSDENIEYEGFKIQIELIPGSNSRPVPKDCIIPRDGERFGVVNSANDEVQECRKQSPGDIDILWNITTPAGTLIYLDFIHYVLKKPNDCELNLVQVFGAKPDSDHKLAHYCGSVANPVMTNNKDEKGSGNVMFIRFYASKEYKKESHFEAKFVSFRTIKNNESCYADEFSCSDGTCIDGQLKCDKHIDCRLKTDEDKDTCKKKTESQIKEPHVMAILVIFSLILSGMTFVFLFKCIRKLYQDHTIIKERIKRSCEDRLDSLGENQLTLDAEHLERDSRRRASLERENHTNEMYKQERNKRKPSSIDSDFPPVTQLDIEEDIWRREVESIPIDTDDIQIEHKGRSRRSDTSRKEESLRSRTKGEKREIRDASVGPPDTKESGCQTRESLFQVEALGSGSTTSGSNGRGFSTFGYSGATIARPSPVPANTSEITIELLRQITPQESIKSQKKMDRRPMSAETTRSAPDVIIVSKPIR